jgi:hypothetical protein
MILLSTLCACAMPAVASAQSEAVSIELDRRSGAAANAAAAQAVEKLATAKLVCLDFKVRLDGSQPDAIRRSAEEENPSIVTRDLVPCGPAMTGQLGMGPSIEYYVVSQGAAGNRIDISIYPGSRTVHVANDVACVFDSDGKSASFRARGLYTPIANRYADVDSEGKPTGQAVLSIQLRPAAASREELSACRP